jgi:hypothetical protein
MEVRSAMGGVGKGEREDGDGGMNFWVKTISEVARRLGDVVTGARRLGFDGCRWVAFCRRWEGGRGRMEERERGDEEGEKILGNKKCCISFLFFTFFLKKIK